MTTLFAPGLFTQPFMLNAFLSGTLVAAVSGLVGFFVVIRGSAFVAHALPRIGFAGAAGAVLVNINPMFGLVAFALAGAVTMGGLGKKGQHDVVIALTLVAGLGTGALFLKLSNTYAAGAYALLFGQLVGVSRAQLYTTIAIAAVCFVVVALLYRPLLFASVTRESAHARGVRVSAVDLLFLVVIGVATAITVPVVGALLSFSLMIGPPATAAHLTHRPGRAMALAAIISVITVWIALVLGYDTAWPIGFFVAALSAAFYGGAHLVSAVRRGGEAVSSL